MAGICSGVVQVVLFNPYDRALYLSVIHQRKFLHRENWGRSFSDLNKGLLPNLLQRVISYGMYFPLEQMWTRVLLNCFRSRTTTGDDFNYVGEDPAASSSSSSAGSSRGTDAGGASTCSTVDNHDVGSFFPGKQEILYVAPLAGQLTGASSGLATNYLSLVKYRQYQRDTHKPLIHDVRKIFHKEGRRKQNVICSRLCFCRE